MIDEKRLLCAFVYSAYESGYCGLRLPVETREAHKKRYRAFISGDGDFPEMEIKATQTQMMERVEVTSERDYIYRGHFEVIVNRIEEETGQSFEQMVKSPIVRSCALACPINFYRVVEANDGTITAKHLFSGGERSLTVLAGLEKPREGDTVSGHWNFFLEVVDGLQDLENYKEISRAHIDRIINATNHK